MPTLDLAALLPSWELTLAAERKSPQTIKTYGDGVRSFLTWCTDNARPATLDRHTLKAFTVALLDSGRKPATVNSRHLAIRRFSAWLTEEGEQDRDDLAGVRGVKIDTSVTEGLTEDQLRAMINACKGTEPLRDRRDEAIIRFMAETGSRAGETAALTLPDLNLGQGTAIIRRGKGGKGRTVPFGPQTARALDRYIRTRRTHRLADTDAVWLGDRGKAFSYDALHKTLAMRANAAKIDGFHPHLLRHTAAQRWLAAGGTESGLMAVAGWTRPDMLIRYTRAGAERRAAQEARRLNLGDL